MFKMAFHMAAAIGQDRYVMIFNVQRFLQICRCRDAEKHRNQNQRQAPS